LARKVAIQKIMSIAEVFDRSVRDQGLADMEETFDEKQAEFVALLALAQSAGLFILGIAATGDELDGGWRLDCRFVERAMPAQPILARDYSEDQLRPDSFSAKTSKGIFICL
jgi:hypothetical protein